MRMCVCVFVSRLCLCVSKGDCFCFESAPTVSYIIILNILRSLPLLAPYLISKSSLDVCRIANEFCNRLADVG